MGNNHRREKMSEQTNPATKTIKIRGPDHPITIEPNPNRVVVSVGGTVLADSRNALILREAGYPAVQYIPRGDVDMTLLERSAHTTYCPYRATADTSASRLAGS